MDSNNEDGDYRIHEHAFHPDADQYRVTYARERDTNDVDCDENEELNKNSSCRFPVSRSNIPGRVKRVVSCKRKTHHLTVARRKQQVSGRRPDAVDKENELETAQDVQQEISMDPLEFPLNVNPILYKTGHIGSEQIDCSALTELTKEHSAMIEVLFERNLRLKVAFTLWQRNFGELLTYFLRIQDTGVFVDFLPLITGGIEKDSLRITIGCCVDLFPLVEEILARQYEEYLIVGLNWIYAVLKRWWKQLSANGYSGSSEPVLEKNFQVFNQQLLKLWLEHPSLRFVPGAAGQKAKVIDSFLSQLSTMQ